MSAVMAPPLPNCGHCGRFTSVADSYTSWGSSGMDEPPEPTLVCARCRDDEYERALAGFLKRGIPPADRRPNWIPSDAYGQARSVARAMFRHGHPRPVRHERVRHELSGTRQVWFCRHCSRPEPHPSHDAGESRRLCVTFCYFERAVGRTFGTAHVQEWCACGWTTGRQRRDSGLVDWLYAGALMREHIQDHDGGDL